MKKLTTVAFMLAFLASNVFAQQEIPFTNDNYINKLQNHPVLFRENKGQVTDANGRPMPSVLFSAFSGDAGVFITQQGLTYVFSKIEKERSVADMKSGVSASAKPASQATEWINVQLHGADIRPEHIVKEQPGSGDSRFFKAHCPQGISGVKEYGKITIREVYPGIDWVLYGSSDKGMKYDFIVHPGADPGMIQLIYEGDQPLTLDSKGNINIDAQLGSLMEEAPVSFTAGDHAAVNSAFKSERLDRYNVRITYQLGDYPKNETLVIDPQLVWGTHFGGSSVEDFRASTHDASNALILTGVTISVDFPVMNTGTYFQSYTAHDDIIIVKFNAAGVLVWSTYYGGIHADTGNTIACDNMGNIFVAGTTVSVDFPVQNNGGYFQTASPDLGPSSTNLNDVFILKFDNDGNREWATCYAGNLTEYAKGIAFDPAGNIFLTGYTFSTDFPVQDNGGYFQGTIIPAPFDIEADLFILKFDNNGTRLWATYYGGVAFEAPAGIVCDANGNVFITGHTFSTADFPFQDAGTYFQDASFGNSAVIILKFDNAGNRLWATGYGGSDGGQFGGNIAIDPNDNIFVTGFTEATNFPLQDNGTYFDNSFNGGVDDEFILKFDNAGNRLWGTYFGGNGNDLNMAIANDLTSVDNCGNVYHCFVTFSSDMPVLDAGGYFDDNLSGMLDAYVVSFTNDGALLWSSYIGGSDFEFHVASEVDEDFNLYLSGHWYNGTASLLNDPGNGAYFDGVTGNNGFVFKFAETPVYTPETTASCNCSGSAAVHVTGLTGPYTYEWSTGQVTTSSEQSDSLSNLCPGAYWVLVSGCTGSDTVHMTVEAMASAYTIETVTTCGCFNSAIISTASGNAPYTFEWSDGTTVTTNASSDTLVNLCPGDYWVTASSCGAPDTTIQITIQAAQPVYAAPEVTVSCNCTGSAVVGISGVPGPYTYHWNNGETVTTDSETHAIQNLCAGNGWVEMTSCSGVDTLFFTLDSIPPPTAEFTVSDTSLCAGNCITFTAMPLVGATYNWNFGNGEIASGTNPVHCYSTAGNYSVSLSVSRAGCTVNNTASGHINVHPVPVASFSADPSAVAMSQPEVQFIDQSSGATTWRWDFGDALHSQSDEPDPLYTYAAIGNYIVVLVVANEFQCSDTASTAIVVYDDFAFYVPNAFTPDNAGTNNNWSPQGAGVDPTGYSLSIFNRWGELIWETGTWGESWDGTTEGGNSPDGVYTWTARVLVKSMPVEYNGSITLIR